MKNYAGKSIVNDFAEHTDEYKKATTQAKRQQLKVEAFDKYMAYLLLKGSDQSKYGSLYSGLSSQFALGNNQYPKTIQAATDILSSHKFDASYRDKTRKGKDWHAKDKTASKDSRRHEMSPAMYAARRDTPSRSVP